MQMQLAGRVHHFALKQQAMGRPISEAPEQAAEPGMRDAEMDGHVPGAPDREILADP